MATINLNNFRPAGADLFLESENYLNELADADLSNIQGGATPAAAGIAILVGYYLYLLGPK